MKYATSLPNALWMGTSLPDSWAKILGQLQDACSRFPIGNSPQVCWGKAIQYLNIEIMQYLTQGVWGAGDVQRVLMLFPKPVVFRAVHTSYWILVKNECCKMEVNNLCFFKGHRDIVTPPFAMRIVFKWLFQVTLRQFLWSGLSLYRIENAGAKNRNKWLVFIFTLCRTKSWEVHSLWEL